MSAQQIVVRETAISVVINTAISIGLFLILFGLEQPARVTGAGGYAFDFVPQAFFIALMGSLVPGLLVSARMKTGPKRAVVLRALSVGVAAAVVLGGGAAALLLLSGVETAEPGIGLGAKAVFGAAEALFLTPLAVRHAIALGRHTQV